MSLSAALAARPSLKRHLWLVSLTYPTIPLLGLFLAITLNQPGWLWLTTFIVFGFMPALDHIVGDDEHDILRLMEDEAQQSLFYRYMVHALLPKLQQ